jgi:hypothetical protein
MPRKIFAVSTLFMSLFLAGYAVADPSVVTPQDFFTQVFDTIHAFGGFPWVMKISSVILLVIASMKVSFLNRMFWAHLGALQAWLAPILGLIAGVLSLAASGGITFTKIFAYLSAGAGAIILHELLDTVKAIPGLGSVYVGIIDAFEHLLGGGQ